MPVHDWTRVSAGTFHDFHYSWALEIKRALRRGLLPEGYYVMAEHDVYARIRRTLVIRHTNNDHVVAMLAVLSPGNKSSRHALRSLLDKAVAALSAGVHLMLVDVHPPGPRDPNGIHGALLSEIGSADYMLGAERPLTAAAYRGGPIIEGFAAHFAVGDPIPPMPLFLTQVGYISVPLEHAYAAAWEDVPPRFQHDLVAR